MLFLTFFSMSEETLFFLFFVGKIYTETIIWSSLTTYQYCSAQYITVLIPAAYQPDSLSGVFRRIKSSGMIYLEVGFPLRCFQRLSLPNVDTQHLPLAEQLIHQRFVHFGPLVLKAAPLNHPTPTADRDRTVSRRSEPSSRTALIGEQPNPWDLLQPQDAMSRHRGAKPSRRCELLGKISLLSLE